MKHRLLVLLLLSLALKTQFRVQGTCKNTPGDVHSGVVTLTSVDGLCHSGYVGGVHLASPKEERINYYDDYNFLDGPSFKEYTNVNLMRKKNAQNATGHPTGSVTLTTGGERLYGVTISYSVLGTPAMIAYGNGNTTEYIYDADSTKLKTTWKTRATNALCSMVAAEETGAEAKTDDGILSTQAGGAEACVENSREQVGPFIFTDGKLERALFDGGFCLLSGQHAAYCYYVCDHLGSVREVVSDAWNVQRNGYYAYGGPYGDWNTNADVQPLKFLGKEWDHQHGLDLYDFGARLYDPAVGRWTTMDPLCEKYYSVSPYAYCHNNPVNRIDPDGKDWYQNNYTSYYTWYDGNVERKGFRHIGGKGSVLGMFEHIIDNVLCGVEGLGLESLYSNGFTFDIAPKDKGGLIGSNKRGWDFFDEFVCGNFRSC